MSEEKKTDRAAYFSRRWYKLHCDDCMHLWNTQQEPHSTAQLSTAQHSSQSYTYRVHRPKSVGIQAPVETHIKTLAYRMLCAISHTNKNDWLSYK